MPASGGAWFGKSPIKVHSLSNARYRFLKGDPMIEKGYKANLETIKLAAKHGDLALVDCQD